MSEENNTETESIAANRVLMLDTETTGLSYESGHKIIEIGIIETINGSRTGNNFHVYLDPEREVDEEAEKVHGMDRENLVILSEGKVFKDISAELTNFVQGAHIVAHSAPFDFGHLDAECRRIGIPEISPQVKISDSLKLAGNLFPGRRNNLDGLAKRLDVDTSSRNLHGALIDASILTDVYSKLIAKQKEMGIYKSNIEETTVNIEGKKEVEFTPVLPSLAAKLRVVSLSEDDILNNELMNERIRSSSGDDGFTF
ncbi:DNA polymerase III subunit epsilon [Psychromonas sp. SP041]|uniref:DNA polymerase III subunit epsilon n=1 Tax=Psychromonas sp. SP041 TaxID=1365007 RepID=UPI0010C7DE6A|nr:DNA polymerase III subunit epsilon [Psychromonas sp. SP041]